MGIFEGKYCNDCRLKFPESWFLKAKISDKPDPLINYFGVKSRQPLGVWQEKGWIIGPDPRGWFQWYCRFANGRRIPRIDKIQIKRWKAFKRHVTAIKKNCENGDIHCRRKQRQAILQWAYNPYI